MLFASDPLQPVVDGTGCDLRGQRPKVVGRRARDGRELAETPVRQSGGATGRLAEREVVIVRLGPEVAGVDRAFFDPLAPCGTGDVTIATDLGVPRSTARG